MRGRNYNGLGGLSSHASSMISSLKNNLKARSIDNFKSSRVSGKYKEGTIDKKASPELLKELREKTKRAQKTRLIKKSITLVIIALLFFLFAWLS